MTNHVLSTMCVMLHFSLRTQKYDPPRIMYNVCNALSKSNHKYMTHHVLSTMCVMLHFSLRTQKYDPPRIEYNVCNASFQFKNTKI